MAEMSSSLLPSMSPCYKRNWLLSWGIGMMLVSALADDVPPVFLFGDSTFDVETNDCIPTRAKANFPYNGIDFPNALATGRFSNGYNNADEIVSSDGIFNLMLQLDITNIEEACSGQGTLNAEEPCFVDDSPNLCPNRGEYLFWDLFHPTQYATHKAAVTLFTGGPTFVVPMNLGQLARASA
ncbi:GDSL esterase/lipase LTL1-like [Rhodamnia argentea]|uniref:GDSL esterase/lipase LTL1-like n=1 Tax=Rhodamnia argentea TaxID=178133 RepID=A0A8B8MRV8_9MYRT|nr:GDSL esterase/lipase LTL1-like [Rhodamnia argentea]